MAYVTVPKDLTHVKSKVVFGLTKRQLICFGGALLVGVPLYFLTRDYLSTSAAALLYVPTDFDTIEKAFSGVKTAEKGIKQGLSRSITDSESPFSLYSVVDFCRSKVRRHRGV